MRYFLVLLLLFIARIGAAQASGNYTNALLTTVLNDLEKKHNLKIAYDPKLVASVTVTASFTDVPMEEALKTVLKNTELSFQKVKRKYYTILPSKVEWDIAGTVEDASGNPIPYAKLRILSTHKGAYCDENGHYAIKHNSDIAPIVEISAFGYKKQRISADQLQTASNIQMAVDLIDYPEIVVEYLTEGVFTGKTASALTVAPDQLGAVPGTTESDIFQLVQTVPGINSASATVNEIQIRGGTSDQNQLLWDGIPIYQPGHFNGMISSINPSIINRADLHRGVYDPFFGGRASGLIDLHSIDKIPTRTQGSVGINFLQGDLYVATPVSKKLGIMVSGRRSFLNLWPSPTYNSYADRVYQTTEIGVTESGNVEGESGEAIAQFQTVNRFSYQDLNAKVLYQPNENNQLTVSGIYAANWLNYSTEFADEEARETLLNDVVSASVGLGVNYQRRWNKSWTSSAAFSFSEYDYLFDLVYAEVIDNVVDFQASQDKFNFITHTDAKVRTTYQIDSSKTLDFGYQLTRHQVDYSIAFNEEIESIGSVGANQASIQSVHTNYTFSKNKWLIKTGIRGSYFTGDDYFYFEPRIHAQYDLNTSWQLKSALGMQHQFVSQIDQLDDVLLGLSNRVWVMADTAEIPVVRGVIADAGFVFRKKGWLLEAEGYVKELRNIVSFSDNPTFSSGLLRGDALSVGIDVLLKKRWKNFRSWISYSYSQVDYTFLDFAEESFVAPFNQPHMLRWGNTFEWRNFQFSAALKIASGMPYTPIDRVVLNPDPPQDAEGEELYLITYQTPYSARFALFHQLDLTVFYNLLKNPDKRWNLKMGVSCFNVYNRQNTLSRRFEIDEVEIDGQLKIETNAIDKYFLGITPNAVLRLELK